MHPVCSFCGEHPVVAWFEGPHLRNVVDSADKVRSEEAWLACKACLYLVDADDREGLVERSLERQRRKDMEKGRERSLSEEAMIRRTIRSHLAESFWRARSE